MQVLFERILPILGMQLSGENDDFSRRTVELELELELAATDCIAYCTGLRLNGQSNTIRLKSSAGSG